MELEVPNEEFIMVGERKLSYKLWGEIGRGEAWVMVHGWLDNASSFDLLIPLLMEKSPTEKFFICVDLPGHGLSEKRTEGVYHNIDYVADLHHLVTHFNLEDFSLLGHSLGSGVSSIYAGAFGKKLKRLILLEGLTPSTNNPGESPKLLVQSITSSLLPPSEFDNAELAIKRRAEKNVIGTLPFESAAILARRGLVMNEKNKISWRYDINLKRQSRSKLSYETILEFVSQIECPTLFIVTSDGLYKDAKIAGQPFYSYLGYFLFTTLYRLFYVLSRIPVLGVFFYKFYYRLYTPMTIAKYLRAYGNLKVCALEGGGHHPHLIPEYADRIAQAIVSWC